MKKISCFFLCILLIFSCNRAPKSLTIIEKKSVTIDSTDMTNNFYDNTAAFPLSVAELNLDGEIANPGKVDFSSLPMHSVIVKEALLDSTGKNRFTGAFRYDGYSLFDILDKAVVKKVNADEFRSVIDLYVEIVNARGEKAVFSWGEIYYPVNLHKIIIASQVSRIVPSKTRELWPLPAESRIVDAGDLVSERNISSPVKITVKSYPHKFIVKQGMSPMFSSQIDLFDNNKKSGQVAMTEKINSSTYNTIFYGRGKGIHSTTPFEGVLLKDVLRKYFPVTRENLRTGIFCVAGPDGYRSVISYSELFNRNDQQEFMLIKTGDKEDGGLYRIFAASDFFSDRAIKSLSEIHFLAQ